MANNKNYFKMLYGLSEIQYNQIVKVFANFKEVDKVIRELEDFLKRQEAEFLKIANKLNLALDQDNMIELTKQNMKKLKTKIGESGGLLQFNYITPITRPLEIFNQENPLDAHPLVVFISYVGVGSDGAMHFVGINIHHVPAQYRKLFWNWIVREFLIKGKNNRRRLEIPQSLYFQLKDNPELRFAIQGYRRYSTKQAKNIHRILLKDYENIFAPRFKARFKVWSQRHSKFIQRPKK